MKLPDPVPENGLEPDLRRRFNELLRVVRTLQVRESGTVAVSHTQAGTFVEVKASAAGNGNNSNIPRWG